MLIVRHLGTPNSGFNGCHCMRDPVLYRSMVALRMRFFLQNFGTIKRILPGSSSPSYPEGPGTEVGCMEQPCNKSDSLIKFAITC